MPSDLVWSSDPSLQGKLPQKGAMGSSRARGDSRPGQSNGGAPVRKHLPKGPCVSLETSGRNGKGVTLVTGLALPPSTLEDLGKALRQACGTGGTVKDGAIEVQGDHREKIQKALEKQGIQARKV
jgi:predicted translation initiation factor SUI1